MLPGTELVTSESTELAPTVPEQQLPAVKSPGDFRTESIAHALDAAYARASMLTLTEKEAAELAKDFPDEAFRLGAGGDPELIYIEHAYLRKRLNEVLGVGAAVPIRRREWNEEFRYSKQVGRDRWEPRVGIRIYVDLVLVVRGCVVGEAIGDACYYPDNAKTNYSDALESAKSNAFRRCCKEFGVGLQAWMKGWSEEWKRKNAPAANGDKSAKRDGNGKQQQRETKPAHSAAPKAPANWPKSSCEEITEWIDSLTRGGDCIDGIKLVIAANLEPSETLHAVTVLREKYYAVLSSQPDAVRKKAEGLTKWVDEQLAELTKADLDAQGKETFSGDTFTAPRDWPNTPTSELVGWVAVLKSTAAIRTALGMFVNEPSRQTDPQDWEALINGVARRYKSVTKNFTADRDKEVEDVVKVLMEQIATAKAAAAKDDGSFNPPAEESVAT